VFPAENPICAVVIDDEPDVLELVERTLQRTGRQVEVLPFSCPQEALDFFERLGRSDFPLPESAVVFCDIRMPKINGFDVIERIRAMRKFDGLRIYVISTSCLPRDRERATRAGADGHLAKFPTADEFEEVLASVA
jgi:CheY-like chemotaxis protein